MCRSPAVRASGEGERRLLHPANWKYRPRPGIRTSPKSPLSTVVFCEFRCHEAAVRDLTTPARSRRTRNASASTSNDRLPIKNLSFPHLSSQGGVPESGKADAAHVRLRRESHWVAAYLSSEHGSQARSASARVNSPAAISLQPETFWPAHSGEKSPLPKLSALARNGNDVDAAIGNSGACGFIGPSSRIRRFTMPRAGLPVKTFVSAVTRAESLFSAAR